VTLTADDRFAILELLAHYNRLADERDVEGTVALYHPDGVITGHMATPPGHDGLREGLPQLFDMEGTLKRHLSLNHVVEERGDRVVARSMLLVVEAGTVPGVGATADITDEVVKVDGHWRVLRHHVVIDPAMFAAAGMDYPALADVVPGPGLSDL
jgi:ketosteroid isomerase-like protein